MLGPRRWLMRSSRMSFLGLMIRNAVPVDCGIVPSAVRGAGGGPAARRAGCPLARESPAPGVRRGRMKPMSHPISAPLSGEAGAAWRGALPSRLEVGDNVLATLQVDLDAQLRFADAGL